MVVIAGQEFEWMVSHEIETVVDERSGPRVRPPVEDLKMVRKPKAWGSYFRTSPIEISAEDFDVLRTAVLEY